MACGADMVQLREPDLPARELFLLSKAAAEIAARFCCSLLVNDRADIAVACGAGVHLTTRSVRPSVVRRTFGSGLLMGVSTHNIDEVREAEDAGANFVVFGPVYETETKKRYGPPVGPGSLQDVASRSGIPVLALGGINELNFREALKAGAAGIAGISMFADSTDLKALVTRVKSKE
jgi:thiamine-phosphate pyrophosphorylase